MTTPYSLAKRRASNHQLHVRRPYAGRLQKLKLRLRSGGDTRAQGVGRAAAQVTPS